QAEDGIRDFHVTGVQTCALPISPLPVSGAGAVGLEFRYRDRQVACKGFPVRLLSGGVGAGFQFREMSPDARKNLSDFVEALRGRSEERRVGKECRSRVWPEDARE